MGTLVVSSKSPADDSKKRHNHKETLHLERPLLRPLSLGSFVLSIIEFTEDSVRLQLPSSRQGFHPQGFSGASFRSQALTADRRQVCVKSQLLFIPVASPGGICATERLPPSLSPSWSCLLVILLTQFLLLESTRSCLLREAHS